jgi:biopolymer transport protein ExbD
MRSQRRASKLKLITEISITPLMDLVFILLFAFMVAVPLVTQHELALSSTISGPLPPTSPPSPAATFTLSVSEDGSFQWADAPVLFEALPSIIKQSLAAQPQLGVILELPPNRPAQDLVRLMNLLDDLGVTRTAVRLVSSSDQSSAPKAQNPAP